MINLTFSLKHLICLYFAQVNREKGGLVNKIQSFVMDTDFVKNKIFDTARKQVLKASNGLYPAPLKVRYYKTLF